MLMIVSHNKNKKKNSNHVEVLKKTAILRKFPSFKAQKPMDISETQTYSHPRKPGLSITCITSGKID